MGCLFLSFLAPLLELLAFWGTQQHRHVNNARSLISAFTLTSLYLNGVKQGDTQATIAGVLIAVMFMMISYAKPLDELAPQRPPSRIFSLAFVLAVAGHVVIHLLALLYVLAASEPFVDRAAPEMEPDADFRPNVINTTVFLIGLVLQVNVFGTGYRGRPFMQGLFENRPFLVSMLGTWLFALVLTLGTLPDVNEYLELVPLDAALRSQLLLAIVADTGGSWAWELALRGLLGA